MAGSAAASMPAAEPVLLGDESDELSEDVALMSATELVLLEALFSVMLTGGYACFAFLAFLDCAILPTDP